MKKVLFIKANPKKDSESYSMNLANAFIEEYGKANPDDVVETLDLYRENIRPLDGPMVRDLTVNPDSEMAIHAKKFADSDRYVVAAPFWNFSFPAILKSYIDYISIPGILFAFTEKGPVGLLSGMGKKVMYITARGGVYESEQAKELEMGDRHLRRLFNFFGIDDFNTVAIEGTNYFQGTELEKRMKDSLAKARKLAQIF